MSSTSESARKAVVWDYVGTLITRSGYFIFSILLARLLTPDDFGIIGIVLIFTGFAQAIVDMGFSTAIIQAKTVDAIQLSTVFLVNLIISSLLTVSLFFSSNFIADFYSQPVLKPITQAISFIFLINGLNAVQVALLRRDLEYKFIAQVSFISTIVGGILAVTAALLDQGVWSLVYQVLTIGLVNVIYTWSRSSWRPQLKFDLSSVHGLWNFGGYMFLDSIFANIYTRFDVFFIGKIFTPGILGLYLRAKSINSFIVEFSSQSISKVLFPAVSRVQDDTEKVRTYLIKALDVTGLITFFLLGWMYLTASESVIILFGEKWTGAIIYYKWLALIGYGFPLGSILISVLRGQGYSRLYFIRSLMIYFTASFAYVNGLFNGMEAFLQTLVITTMIGILINVYFSKLTTGIGFTKHLYHAFGFAPVSLVSVWLVLLFSRVIHLDNLYYVFALKTIFYTILFATISFLLRREFLISLFNQNFFRKRK